eukprot:gene36366-47337_t
MEAVRIDIKETKEEISAAKLVGGTARQDSLLTYLIELQRKENILLQQTLAQAPTDELPLIEGLQFSPVYWDHYKHIQATDEAEQSPEYSLAVSNSSISVYPELSSVEDPYTVLMMIERSDLREFTTSAPYRTMLDWLDGWNRKRRLAGQKRIPSIKLTAAGREESEKKKMRDGAEVDTVKVYIKIWSANAVLMKDLESMLKEGSYRDADGAWITFVNVFDVATFKHCLECKALQTQKLWDENGGCQTEL